LLRGPIRGQITLFPAALGGYVGEDNPARAIDVFVDGLDLANSDLTVLHRLPRADQLIIRRHC
jgi:hypothetical protein